MSQSTNESLVD